MNTKQLDAISDIVADVMAESVEKMRADYMAEIGELKKQLAEKPDYARMVADEVAKAMSAIRQPQDGKDCDMEAVKSLVVEAVKSMPAPRDGKDGTNGLNGADGKDGAAGVDGKDGLNGKDGANGIDGKSITLADVQPILSEAIKTMQESATKALDAAIKAIPAPINGKDGIDGKDGAMGDRGEKGADGIGLAGAMLDREGALLVTLTNGEVKSLGVVVGKDGSHGANGKDGLDGISLDAFDMDYIEETHEVRIKASCAGRTKELRYPAGGLRPAGYWREGAKAKACETWVHDGSLWIAVKDTPSKPQTGSDDWIIAARKGRDGESIVKTVNAGPAAPIKLGGAK